MIPNYPGSKGGAGVAEKIISAMPAHTVYIEPFLGGGAIFRRKAPAALSILADVDPSVVKAWLPATSPAVKLLQADALQILTALAAMHDRSPAAAALGSVTLVYLDPPYLRSTRTRSLYRCELETPEDHARLLYAAVACGCMVMISGYKSDLYADILQGWRAFAYPTMTRGGVRTEYLWMNFPPPAVFHDTRWVGAGYRERERIKRKKSRWFERLKKMPVYERQAVASALAMVDVIPPAETAVRSASPETSVPAAVWAALAQFDSGNAPLFKALENV